MLYSSILLNINDAKVIEKLVITLIFKVLMRPLMDK